MLSGVLFDLDGTLLDTAEDFVHIIQAMLQEHGRPPAAAELIRAQVSDGSIGMLSTAFELSPEAAAFAALREDFLSRYEQGLAVHTRPFPGISELLDWLDAEQLPWGVVTNKLSRFSIPLLEQTGLASRCASLLLVPALLPASTSAWATQPRSVSGLIPSCSPTRRTAPGREAGSFRASSAMRIARSRNSSGYFLGAGIDRSFP